MSLNLPEIIDSHCHLDFPEIMENIDQIIARAKHRGVSKFVTICTSEKSLSSAIKLSEKFKEVYFGFGLHPMHVSKSETMKLETELVDTFAELVRSHSEDNKRKHKKHKVFVEVEV